MRAPYCEIRKMIVQSTLEPSPEPAPQTNKIRRGLEERQRQEDERWWKIRREYREEQEAKRLSEERERHECRMRMWRRVMRNGTGLMAVFGTTCLAAAVLYEHLTWVLFHALAAGYLTRDYAQLLTEHREETKDVEGT